MRFKMKQIKQTIFPFSASLVMVLFLTIITTSLSAAGNTKQWFSNSGLPNVRVYIKNAFVYAQVSRRNLNLPASKLKYVNGRLLNEYNADYIQIKDYNGDGYSDIGVLTSVGYGGSNQCYAVFEYLPKFYSYKTRSKKTVCVE